ncbi:hypothetical protein Tco_1471357 [Tanacetum coccineum]
MVISIQNLHILCLFPIITAEVLQSSWERDCFRQNAPVLCARYIVLTTYNTAYPRKINFSSLDRLDLVSRIFLRRAGQASKPSFLQDLAHLSDLYFQADSAMNFVSDSSRLGLRSGYEEFPLFRW